jgi:hypothetical protein
VKARYGDSLAIVEWHPYAHDPMNMNPDDSVRASRYVHNPGQPSLALDGYLEVVMPSDPSQFYGAFDAAIQSVKSAGSYITLSAVGSADTAEGRVVVTLAMDSILPGTNPTLYCVVTEDSLVPDTLMGGSYFRIARRFLPDINGVPVSLARGDTLVDTLTFATAGHRPDKLGAAVFVEDANGTEAHRVLQSATIRSLALTEEK